MFTPGLKIFAHLLYGATSLGCCSITHNIHRLDQQSRRQLDCYGKPGAISSSIRLSFGVYVLTKKCTQEVMEFCYGCDWCIEKHCRCHLGYWQTPLYFLGTFECRVSLKLEKFGRFFLRHLPSINHQKLETLGESRPIFPNWNTLQLNLSYSPTLILLHERVVDERTSIPLLQ